MKKLGISGLLVLSIAAGAHAQGDIWTYVGQILKLDACNNAGEIVISDGTDLRCYSVSGDGSMTSAGVFTVANDSHSHTTSTLPATLTETNQNETITGTWTFPSTNFTDPAWLRPTGTSYGVYLSSAAIDIYSGDSWSLGSGGNLGVSKSYWKMDWSAPNYTLKSSCYAGSFSDHLVVTTAGDCTTEAWDFNQTGTTVTVPTPTSDQHAATKKYVDDSTPAEADTLDTVADRGASTDQSITTAGLTLSTSGSIVNEGQYSADTPPGSPDALDDEFNDATFSGWTWNGTTPSVIDESTYPGFLQIGNGGSAFTDSYMTKTVTWSGDFDMTVHFAGMATYLYAGVFVADSSGNGYTAVFYHRADIIQFKDVQMTAWAAGSWNTTALYWANGETWLRILRDGSNLEVYVSTNGITWMGVKRWTSVSTTFERAGLAFHGGAYTAYLYDPTLLVNHVRVVD